MNEIYVVFLSAFAGAFFAFLFTRLAEFLNKIYTRQVKHYNGLINLETELNYAGTVIGGNIYLFADFLKVIKKGNVYPNNLHTIPINRGHFEELYNLDYMNDLLTYYNDIEKINDDINTINSWYGTLRNSLAGGTLPHQMYVINMEPLSKQLVLLEKFHKSALKDTELMLAKTRVLVKKDKPLGSKIMEKFHKNSTVSEQEIKSELKKLMKELSKSKKDSRKRINKALENE